MLISCHTRFLPEAEQELYILAPAWKLIPTSSSPTIQIHLYSWMQFKFMVFLFVPGIMEMLPPVRYKTRKQRRPCACGRKTCDTANNGTTNHSPAFLESPLSAHRAAHAVVKQTDVCTTTMETTATLGPAVVRYGTCAPASSNVLHKQKTSHVFVNSSSPNNTTTAGNC